MLRPRVTKIENNVFWLNLLFFFTIGAIITWYLLRNRSSRQLGGKLNENLVKFYSASWCPHCRNFEDTWNELKTKFPNWKFEKIDCSNGQCKVNGYPTLTITKNGVEQEIKFNRNDLNAWKSSLE